MTKLPTTVVGQAIAQSQQQAAGQNAQVNPAEQPQQEVIEQPAVEQPAAPREFPRDADGNIDYAKLTTGPDVAEALLTEFGTNDALTIIDQQIADVKARAEKASKKGTPIDQARAKRKFDAERMLYEQAKTSLETMVKAEAEAAMRSTMSQEVQPATQQVNVPQIEGNEATIEQSQVPDMALDKASDARTRGYRMDNGQRIDRPAPIAPEQMITGAQTMTRFSVNKQDEIPTTYAVIDARQAQPSHKAGRRNPYFFINEAQPKERTDVASDVEADRIAKAINPEEITGSVSAYTGAPITNDRGEVIQGNNRTAALQRMYEQYPEQAAAYKQYLIDNAERYGLDPQAVAGLDAPMLVRIGHFADDEAIRLGQKKASDNESGGTQRIDARSTLKQLGDKAGSFMGILYRSEGEGDESLTDAVRSNARASLTFLHRAGIINNTQFGSAFNDRGEARAEVVEDLINITKEVLFKDGKDNLETMFRSLPEKAKRAILQTVHRDKTGEMIPVLQEAIEVYYHLTLDPLFSQAKSVDDAQRAAIGWFVQTQMDFTTGAFVPSERYSVLAMSIAASLRTETQKNLTARFDAVYDSINGQGGDLFGEPIQLTRDEAIREYFNTQPYERNQQVGPVALSRKETGPGGQQGSSADNRSQEQGSPGEGAADNRGNTEQGNEQSKISNQPEGENTPQGSDNQEENTNFVQNEGHEVSEQVPSGENGTLPRETEGMGEEPASFRRGFEASIRNAQEDKGSLSEREVADIAEAFAKSNGSWIPLTGHDVLGTPLPSGVENEVFYNENDGFVYKVNNLSLNKNSLLSLLERIDNYNLLFPDTEYTLVGFTGFGKGSVYPILRQRFVQGASFASFEEIDGHMLSLGFHKTKKEAEYTNGQFIVSDLRPRNVLKDADGDIYIIDAVIIPAPAAIIAEQESVVNTNPSEAQKEAGNYKKGHVTIQGMEITIEQPKGSMRSGVDENGREWSTVMQNTYGYFKRTEGKDGDQVDVFLGDNLDSDKVFIIDQKNPKTGVFDESKIMLGFDSAEQAKAAYLSNYEQGWGGFMAITEQPVDDFKKWLYDGARQRKPFSEYVDTPAPVEVSRLGVKGASQGVKGSSEGASQGVKPEYGGSNTLVSKERYEELREQMRKKLNNLNVGFDPEMFTIGAQMAMYHIEAGAHKFADFANRMIEDLGQAVTPYLKSIYEGARYLPGMNELSKKMDSSADVADYDIEHINDTTNDEQERKEERTVEAIEAEAEATESTTTSITAVAQLVGSDQQRAGEVKAKVDEQIDKVEALIAEVDVKIARLTELGYSTEGIDADTPVSVLAKGPIKKDMTKFVKTVAQLTGLETEKAYDGVINLNIATAVVK
jgi:hypothetical protein